MGLQDLREAGYVLMSKSNTLHRSNTMHTFKYKRFHIPTGETSEGEFTSELPWQAACHSFYVELAKWNKMGARVWQYWKD